MPKVVKEKRVKIAVNHCFGGFSLSPLAIKRLAELSGKNCYFFKLEWKRDGEDKYIPITLKQADKEFMWFAYSVPNPEDYNLDKEDEDGLYKSANARAEEISLGSGRDVERDNPLLIQVIKELGKKANGKHAQIEIVEIPEGIEWEIEEYDGSEHVAEKHRTW